MKIEDLKFGHTYIVEVAFEPNNVIHRAIATGWREDDRLIDLFSSGYENPLSFVAISGLSHFEVISEIDMKPSSFDTPESLAHKKRA